MDWKRTQPAREQTKYEIPWKTIWLLKVYICHGKFSKWFNDCISKWRRFDQVKCLNEEWFQDLIGCSIFISVAKTRQLGLFLSGLSAVLVTRHPAQLRTKIHGTKQPSHQWVCLAMRPQTTTTQTKIKIRTTQPRKHHTEMAPPKSFIIFFSTMNFFPLS